jgi:alkylation response protein AidB-like acyl-CoA dehydrogenase
MTTVDDRTMTAPDVLDAARALGPTIAARAAEIEAARRVPADLLEGLRAAGVIRLLLPASHGGIEATLADALRVFETLATADASTGWTAMIGAGSWIDLAGLPRATFDAVYAEGPDVPIAGVISPSGTIASVDGGYRVDGRWSFASGCEHARWIFVDCVEGVVDGEPQLRMALLAPNELVIEDTWYVSGLAGTGSHHVRADGVVVPASRTFRTLDAPPCIDATIVRVPPPALLACAVASVAVGTAQAALDDIVALAAEKVPLLSPTALAADPTFHLDLAIADTELRAARGLLDDAATALWATAEAGAEPALADRARVRATAAWVTARAAAVVGVAYHAGGGSSLFAEHPLQRRLRDVHAVAQHFLVRRATLTTAGGILAGNDVAPPLF